MPLQLQILENMEDIETEISVIDVYDIASEIGKEFEKIIDAHGAEAVTSLMPKVINALEHLEVLATKNERENVIIQELKTKIVKLESDKIEKAEDRQKFERELEQIEDHWREESRDLVAMVTRLQEENRKLANVLASREDQSPDENLQPVNPEVDIAVLQRLREMVDQLRDQLRTKEREISNKNLDIDNLAAQVEKLTAVSKELGRKHRVCQFQLHALTDERADLLAQLQDQHREINTLKQELGHAQNDNADLAKSHLDTPDLTNKAVYDLDDPNRPRFTTAELKEILHERNELKAKVSDLEDELEMYRPKRPESSVVEDEEETPVQGPIPYEPDDAPWRKSDSGIRKFFRKLFSETNVTFLGNSPKHSLSSFSKMALASGSTLDSPV